MSETVGKVWLVGAGPGDAGLLTRKGYDVLQQAEVVVYDSLVGDGVLALVPASAQTINVGKRANNHTMRQEQINEVLLEQALLGLRVVRLKGGDPFLFGRGGEELELLEENGVPYEVVPGITSAIAVPAYNGIPVTHRDFTSSVHIITGHRREGFGYDIDFKALVDTKGTLVFLMGVRSLPDIMEGLMEAGMNPETPAAVLQEGTTAGQRRVVATVSTLDEEAKRAQISAPAIIVVGNVCSLADQFAWRERMPLQGCKVLVTRPAGMVSTMSQRLRSLGAEVLDVPSIDTVAIDENPELDAVLSNISSYQWIVLTSPTGVRVFFEKLKEAGVDMRALAQARFAVLGTGTQRELRSYGIMADLIPEESYGYALGAALAKTAEPGSKILIPRARIGNKELVEALQAFDVEDVATYDTVPMQSGLVDVTGRLNSGSMFCVAFTSSSGVRSFVQANPDADLSQVRAACIGKMTQATAAEYGMRTWMSDEPSMDSLAQLVVNMFSDFKKGEL